MTREEAIIVLKESINPNVEKSFNEWGKWDKEKHLPAVNMAIEALSAEYEDYEHATLVDIKEPLKVAVVHCKDCKSQKTCKFAQWQGNYGYCSQGERKEELNCGE